MVNEKLTGEIYASDITALVHELNKNKDKFRSFVFDRRGDYYTFSIIHSDSKDSLKLLGIIQKHIARSKGKVNREVLS